jgi:ABC-type branched-subunit amino acid transport system substrate-binding protein
VVAFSNDSSVASEGTFLLGFRLEEQIDRIVRFALSKSLKRIAALAPDDLYGETAMDAFKRAVTEGGGDLGPTVFYPSDGDPSAIVREIADHDDSPFHAVLIADGGARLHMVAKLLAFHGVGPDDVCFLGTMRWQDDPKTLQEPALQDGWFPSSPLVLPPSNRTRGGG